MFFEMNVIASLLILTSKLIIVNKNYLLDIFFQCEFQFVFVLG
jgi:hypothetical protein